MRRLALFAVLVFSLPLAAQLNGGYTCANGNPGSAFDYGDIGAFFDDLEALGVSGPVTLNVFDDGGPFTSSASYCLGYRPVPTPTNQYGDGVVGLSLTNPLVIKAAPGESPVIQGSGAPQGPSGFGSGTLTFIAIDYTTVEGLTLRNGQNWGFLWFGNETPKSNFRIARCRIHAVANGPGIYFGPAVYVMVRLALGIDAVIIENNMIWDCGPAYPGGHPLHFIDCSLIGYVGLEWIIRHNTITHLDAIAGNHALGITGPENVEQFHSNVVYMSSAETANPPYLFGGVVTPVFSDFNVYYCTGTARFRANTAGATPAVQFTTWQGLGYDLNGVFANPMLVNVATGQEDLHLQPGSPCIDRSLINSVILDIDGDTRPQGGARDSGADEYLPPDMAVEFASAPVNHLGAVGVGNVPTNGALRAFTIRNAGLGQLVLQNPAVAVTPGVNCAVTTVVQTQPAALQLAPNASTTFSVFIDPVTTGAFDLVVSIASNDPLKNPYTFTVSGTGVPPNQPARANIAAGSTFAGAQNGPFQCPMQPGAALVNATLDLTDPDADPITILSITQPAVALAGVTPPGIGTPAHPRALTWTGVVDAANAPGNYTWVIQFRDSVNQSVITINATIQVANLPPTHLIAAAQGGDGSQGNPYQCGFNRGDDSAASVNLCTVTDPNTGQTPFISQTIKAATNPGVVNFVFVLNAGMLSASPAGTLNVAEAGQHDYEVRVSDGTNLVSIHALIFVANQPMNFTTPSQLASGETGTAYTATLSVTGAIGTVTFTVTTGALPSGLTLDATGQISGIPTQAETATFTVQAADATGATATRQFQVAIDDPPATPPPPRTGSGGNGCAAGAGAGLLWLLLPLLAPWKRENGKRKMAQRAT